MPSDDEDGRGSMLLLRMTRRYTEPVILQIAHLALQSTSEGIRLAACRELLDRGYGKPQQAIVGPDGGALMPPVINLIFQAASAPHQDVIDVGRL